MCCRFLPEAMLRLIRILAHRGRKASDAAASRADRVDAELLQIYLSTEPWARRSTKPTRFSTRIVVW